MTRDDAPAICSYLGVAATLVFGLFALGDAIARDDSAVTVLYPYSVAIGSSNGIAQLAGVLLGIVQWPIYGFAFGSMVAEREPFSVPYAIGIGLFLIHVAFAAFLRQLR